MLDRESFCMGGQGKPAVMCGPRCCEWFPLFSLPMYPLLLSFPFAFLLILFFSSFFLYISFTYLFIWERREREREREGERKTASRLPSVDTVHKYLHQPGLVQAEVGNQECNQSLPYGCKVLFLRHPPLPLRVLLAESWNQEPEPGVGFRLETQWDVLVSILSVKHIACPLSSLLSLLFLSFLLSKGVSVYCGPGLLQGIERFRWQVQDHPVPEIPVDPISK